MKKTWRERERERTMVMMTTRMTTTSAVFFVKVQGQNRITSSLVYFVYPVMLQKNKREREREKTMPTMARMTTCRMMTASTVFFVKVQGENRITSLLVYFVYPVMVQKEWRSMTVVSAVGVAYARS